MRSWSICIIVAAFSTAWALPLRAQATHIPSASDVGRMLRERHQPFSTVDVLTQRVGHTTASERDAIADTLVAVVLSDVPDEVRLTAGVFLSASSQGLGSSDQAAGGVPYAGAAQRMYRIVMEGDRQSAARMIEGLRRLPDTAEALRMLRLIATSRVSVAYRAVEALGTRMGPGGENVAHDLFERHLVHERVAVDVLSGIARAKGWKRSQ
jgi:hypothetical protein